MTGIAPGLADPAHDSQRLFRAVLDAFAHPGRVVSLSQAPAGVGPLSRAATAFLLTLVDRDTPLWLSPDLDTEAIRDFVRFHTGAPLVAREVDAAFAVLTPKRASLIDGFSIGTDSYPDRSATLVIEVPTLISGPAFRLRGPGIESETEMTIASLPPSFPKEWAANRALFPCGVDLVFTAGVELLALPRSIAVEV